MKTTHKNHTAQFWGNFCGTDMCQTGAAQLLTQHGGTLRGSLSNFQKKLRNWPTKSSSPLETEKVALEWMAVRITPGLNKLTSEIMPPLWGLVFYHVLSAHIFYKDENRPLVLHLHWTLFLPQWNPPACWEERSDYFITCWAKCPVFFSDLPEQV